MRNMIRLTMVTAVAAVAFAFAAVAESVSVKYRGLVDLTPFACEAVVSSFVRRVCYDEDQRYMLISLQGVYYHYCAIPPDVVDGLLAAPSVGGFYNAHIKSNFDCRIFPPPDY